MSPLDASEPRPLDYPLGKIKPGEPIEIGDGFLLIPMPVPFPPFAVNCLAIAEIDGPFAGGWTIVDTGMRSDETKGAWAQLLKGPLAGRPIRRLIATHHHPDHLGLAGWFQREHGVALWTTRTAWLFARMMQLDIWDAPPAEAEAFMRRCGYDEAMMARYRERAVKNYAVTVEPLPLGFHRIAEGEELRIGGRDWRVLFGHGHAPDHALFWDRAAGVVIGGDQILPKITPNIGVYPTEPEADPLGDWMASCRRLATLFDDDLLILPGHGEPFRGARRRLLDVRGKHERALDRLEAHLDTPRTVVECFSALYRREITTALEGLATVEAVSHLNRLSVEGRAAATDRGDGVALWRRT